MTFTDLERIASFDSTTRNDQRFDGQFYSAVMTTGIFCRPGCPGKPRAENVRFFSTAAAAAESGFRPCLRCHPESAPDPPEWHATSPVVARALRLIGEGALDDGGVTELAGRLSVSARQLQRLFVEELGAPPVAVAQTRRLLFAKKLIDETDLSMTEIAFSAGYSSVRRFNEALKQTYARTPSDLRRKRRRSSANPSSATIELKLFYRNPYNWPAMLAFLSQHAMPLVETVDRTTYRRTIQIGDVQGVISVRPLCDKRAVLLRVPADFSRFLLPITERVKQIFDLKADPAAIAEDLSRNHAMIELLEKHPGVRLPGCWEGFDATVNAIVRRAYGDRSKKLLTDLVEGFGTAYTDSGHPGLTRLFPTPEQLVTAPLEEVGIPAHMSDSIRGLAGLVARGAISFDGGVDFREFADQLRKLPGVDDHVVPYVALRTLGQPDLDLSCNSLIFACVGDAMSSPVPDDSAWQSYAGMTRWAATRSRSFVTA